MKLSIWIPMVLMLSACQDPRSDLIQGRWVGDNNPFPFALSIAGDSARISYSQLVAGNTILLADGLAEIVGNLSFDGDSLIVEARVQNRSLRFPFGVILKLDRNQLIVGSPFHYDHYDTTQALTFIRPQFDSTLQLREIQLSTTGCFGKCPVFDLKVSESGQLSLNAFRFLDRTGPFAAQILPSELEHLRNLVKQAFVTRPKHRVKNICYYGMPDVQRYYLFIRTQDDSFSFFYCWGAIPFEFQELTEVLVRAVESPDFSTSDSLFKVETGVERVRLELGERSGT